MGSEETRRRIADEVREPKRVLIVRLSAFGDIIHSMHAVAGLVNALPRAEIGWLTSTKMASLVKCARFVNNVHVVDTSGSPIRKLHNAIKIRDELAGRYDITVDLQGLLKSAIVAKLAGTGVLGYAGKESREGSRFFYRWRIEPPVSAEHIVEKQVALFSGLVPVAPVRKLDLAVPEEDARKAQEKFRWAEDGGYSVIHRRTRWATKDLPGELVVSVTKTLENKGRKVVVTTADDADAAELAELLKGTRAEVVKGLSLSELVWLYQKAELYVGPDTGPTHLASALGIPTVAIYGPTDARRNGPYGPKTISIRCEGDSCAPCWKKRCRKNRKGATCISSVTVEDVMKAVGTVSGDGKV